eukprot:Clim_evm6s31 gene=Clim_evmTU6s31
MCRRTSRSSQKAYRSRINVAFVFFGIFPCGSGCKSFCGLKQRTSCVGRASGTNSSSKPCKKARVVGLFKKKTSRHSPDGHCCHGQRCSARHSKRRVNAISAIVTDQLVDGADHDELFLGHASLAHTEAGAMLALAHGQDGVWCNESGRFEHDNDKTSFAG